MDCKQVLVVDDDDGVRKTIELSLQVTTDWKILTAASGKEGLNIAQTEQPDAILLDVMMPNIDGIETFHQLQSSHITKEIPVIFLTATVSKKEQQSLKNLSIQGLIFKPFDALDLHEQICNLLHWQ